MHVGFHDPRIDMKAAAASAGLPGRPSRRLCGDRASGACATTSTTDSSSSTVTIRRNQSGQSLWPSGYNTSNNFEQTALALTSLNHAWPLDERSRRRV